MAWAVQNRQPRVTEEALKEEQMDWNNSVGPFLDEMGVRRLTGLSASQLSEHIASQNVLSVRTSEGIPVFPVFQFGLNGELLPGMSSVGSLLLPISDDSWDLALWLCTKSSSFDGLSAAELLRAGEIERVHRIAKRDGSTLEH
jgi:hypothetical protein